VPLNKDIHVSVKRNNFIKYIWLTQSRADQKPQREAITKEEIVLRMTTALKACTTIVVAK